jgi:hypothetical protein
MVYGIMKPPLLVEMRGFNLPWWGWNYNIVFRGKYM